MARETKFANGVATEYTYGNDKNSEWTKLYQDGTGNAVAYQNQEDMVENRLYEYDGFHKTTKVTVEEFGIPSVLTQDSTIAKEKISKILIHENFYDAENLRYSVEEDGKKTNFVTNGWKVVGEADEDYNTKKRILLGYGIIASEDQEYHYFHWNEHGDTEVITGEQGVLENHYEYDAFGKQTTADEVIRNRYTYNGEQYDEITSQYYLRARFYNPQVARFTQEDVYRGDGLNLYAYCGNSAVMYEDPSGYVSKKCDLSEGGSDSSLKINEIPLAKPGEDLYVGTYSKSSYWSKKTGLNTTHTPHHVVQDAVSSVSHGKGITINIRKDIHLNTETYGSLRTGLTKRQHLAADVAELRGLLKENGYSRSTINAQLNELIKQNIALGGFEK